MHKTIQLCLIGTALSLLAASTSADSITMTFEQTLDLDTGTISDANIIPGEPTGADVVISYHADRVEHAVVFPAGDAVEIAFVVNVPCINVILADVASWTFTSEPIDQALSTNNCVVVRTDQGAMFKIGNSVENGSTVTLNYAAL